MANRERLDGNIRPRKHEPGTGSTREGAALLQGLARCGHCGRKLATHYRGRHSTPGYHCAGKDLVNGRGVYCLNIGGIMLDKAVATSFLAALTPAGLDAALTAEAEVAADYDAALAQHERNIERLHYETQKAERRFLAVDAENRLVARGLEADWEQHLQALEAAQTDLETRRRRRPQALTPAQRHQIRALATDVDSVWDAATTTDPDRKELLHTLLEEGRVQAVAATTAAL